jgi:UDP-N-acetylglucosamine--N-acetylmuramyl-(pentapeptide) pyrophosphoryl-undecaprenol N-acetylglucosamine transferase
LSDIPAQDPNIDHVYAVRAGKFRRYHGEGLRQLLDLRTWALNIRDFFLVLIGIYQSWRLMGRLRPAVVFSRGGFVSVPVCLGAGLHRIPYITHDSDPVPSLANRLIAPWARLHAVALPAKIYPYRADKTVTTGIPLNKEFKPVTPALVKRYRKEIDVPASARLLFVIGGGLGSQQVNRAVADALPHLLRDFKNLLVVHAAGRANETEMQQVYNTALSKAEQGRVRVMGFIPDVYRYSGAADLVITRAGATNLAEFAVQGKACIVIPSLFLAAGHQIKSADYLREQGAAAVLTEHDLTEDPNRLAKQVATLLEHPEQLGALGQRLAESAQPHAAEAIAELILEHTHETEKT